MDEIIRTDPNEVVNESLIEVPQTEPILNASGKPASQSEAWEIALQKSDKGNVTTPDGKPIRKATALYYAMEKDMETLAKQIEAGFTEQTIEFLQFAGRMHKYSAFNQDLIYMQYPRASFIQSFSKWSRAGYQIKKGESGVAVFVPKPYMKVVHRNEQGTIISEEKKAVFFTIAYVFDISQIDPEVKKPPEIFTPLTGSADLLTKRLVEVLADEGIPVHWEYPLNMQAEGVSNSRGVTVRPDLTSVNKFLTLLHESAHSLLKHSEKREELSKRDMETQAEVISFLVSSHFGIQNPLSSDYLKTYGVNKDVLKANLKITQELSTHLITKMEEEYTEELLAEFTYSEEELAELDKKRKAYKRKSKHTKRKKT